MKHIVIVCHARTGGTWVGQLCNTCANVKYLWEADVHVGWNFDNRDDVEKKVLAFVPHVDIKPHFPKGEIDTAVYKLVSPLGQICGVGYSQPKCRADLITQARKVLDARIIHLVRHPVRWVSSVHRWGPRDDKKMRQALGVYIANNKALYDLCKKEPWYYLVRHEDLIKDPANIRALLTFCGLEETEVLHQYVGECHQKDSVASPHFHETTMTKETALNRWRSYENTAILEEANTLAEKYWHELYEPLVLSTPE